MKDDNDRLRDGELGDPEDGAEPMPGARDPEAERAAALAADPFRNRWLPLGDAMPDLFTAEPPPPKWLLTRKSDDGRVRGVLRAGKVGLFVAAGGVGKTQALVQLAVAVAVGGAKQWLDTFDVATPGRVLLALAEEDEDEVRRRLRSAARLLGLRPAEQDEVLRNVVALPLAGTPVGLVARDHDGNVTQTALLDALKAKLAESEGWSLLVLDPLSRWAGPDSETDNAAATRFIEAVESLVTAPGTPAVLIAHHTPKSSRSSARPGATVAITPRGSSALTDGARWVATLSPEDRAEGDELPVGETVRFEIVKSNYAERGEPLQLVRDKANSGALRPMSPPELQQVAAYLQAKNPPKGPTGRQSAAPAIADTRRDDY